jgi:AAA+ superfamily predicted ATPase
VRKIQIKNQEIVMTKKLYLIFLFNIFYVSMLFCATSKEAIVNVKQANSHESWIRDFLSFLDSLDSDEGKELKEKLYELYITSMSHLGNNIGAGIGAYFKDVLGNTLPRSIGMSSEELIKGLMRGLVDPKSTSQFRKEFNAILKEFGKESIKTSGEIFSHGRKELLNQFMETHTEFQKEFGEKGEARKQMRNSAQTGTAALGDAFTGATQQFEQDFGKESDGFKHINTTTTAYTELFRSQFNIIQKALLSDTGKYIGYGIAGATIPLYLVRYTYHYFISKLNEPRIIIETSIGSWPYEYAKWILRFKPKRAAEQLQDMIFAKKVKEQTAEIIAFQQAHKKVKEGFDNILLVGHPGTGKTMFAKAIAAELGMDYIVLTGSSFFQENAGVKAVDQIFGTLTRGRKVVIFIDEIDSIASSRVGKNADSDAYRLLNQLLNYTSTPNKNFILIGATNYPELIDKAFYRRFQHVVEMPLPEIAERIAFLTVAVQKQLVEEHKKQRDQILSVFNATIIQEIATMSEGLSYAELQTIIDHIKSAMRLSEKGITEEMIYRTTETVKTKESSFKKSFLT